MLKWLFCYKLLIIIASSFIIDVQAGSENAPLKLCKFTGKHHYGALFFIQLLYKEGNSPLEINIFSFDLITKLSFVPTGRNLKFVKDYVFAIFQYLTNWKSLKALSKFYISLFPTFCLCWLLVKELIEDFNFCDFNVHDVLRYLNRILKKYCGTYYVCICHRSQKCNYIYTSLLNKSRINKNSVCDVKYITTYTNVAYR